MYCTEVMVKQHANISRMLKVIEKACCAVLDGSPIDCNEFTEILKFIRTYADGHHHRREELVLFPEMVQHLEKSPPSSLITACLLSMISSVPMSVRWMTH